MKKGNIVGEPFAKYVNEQIKQRQSFHGSGFSSSRDPKHLVYLNSKLSWVKMASSVSVNDIKENQDTESENISILKDGKERLTNLGLTPLNNFTGQSIARKAVLFNGLSEAKFDKIDKPESEYKTEQFGGFSKRAGYAQSNSIWNDSFAYGLGGTEFGIQPMPGINSVEVSHLNRGSIRKATITLKAYNRFQFELIDMLYLRLGYTMLLEWGNSHYIENDLVKTTTENGKEKIISRPGDLQQVGNTLIEDFWFVDNYPSNRTHLGVLKKIETYRERYDGNYDGFFGRVSNFNWEFNSDGSYNISIDLISLGDVIESLKINTLSEPVPTANIDTESTSNSSTKTKSRSRRRNYTPKRNNNTILNFLDDVREEKLNLNRNFFSASNTIKSNQSDWDAFWGAKAGDKQYYYYIKFGAFLDFIENKVLSKLKNEDKTFPFVSIERDIDSNIMSLSPNQFSLNPRVCIINSNYFDPPLYEEPSFFKYLDKFYDSSEGIPYGKIMNIYLNFDLIEKVIKSKTDNKGNLSLFECLQSICNEINKSLGSVNNLEPIINENENKLTIIDQNSLPQNQRNKLRKNLLSKENTPKEEEQESIPLELYGYNKENLSSNFVKNFSFKTEIGPDLASIISIGATAQGTVVGSDATAFSKWNEGLKDRFQQEVEEPEDYTLEEFESTTTTATRQETPTPSQSNRNRRGNTQANKEKRDILNYGAGASEFKKYLIRAWGSTIFFDSDYNGTPQYFIADEDFINQGLKLFTSDYFIKLKENQKTTSSIGFIPVKLSIEIDGISGMKIYQSLKINTKFLPKTYPKTLEFLITRVNHSLQDNKWITKIETISQPVIEDIVTKAQPESQEKQPYITDGGEPQKRIPVTELKYSNNLINLLKEEEQYRYYAYDDLNPGKTDSPLPKDYTPKGILTIGYGQIKITYTETTKTSRGSRTSTSTRNVRVDDVLTKDKALANVIKKLDSDIKVIKNWLRVPMTQNEFDALMSFTYNLGPGTNGKSEFVTLLNNKRYIEAGNKLLIYNKSGGETLKGLIRRREKELNLWMKNNPGNPTE
ncbi:lysozyme [bacterium]|nr:lysozyme [bacterium]